MKHREMKIHMRYAQFVIVVATAFALVHCQDSRSAYVHTLNSSAKTGVMYSQVNYMPSDMDPRWVLIARCPSDSAGDWYSMKGTCYPLFKEWCSHLHDGSVYSHASGSGFAVVAFHIGLDKSDPSVVTIDLNQE